MNNKRIFIEELSQLEDPVGYADYSKDVSGVFVGKFLKMPGVIKSDDLEEEFALDCILDVKDLLNELILAIKAFKDYMKSGNEAFADRYLEKLSRMREISCESEVRIIKKRID